MKIRKKETICNWGQEMCRCSNNEKDTLDSWKRKRNTRTSLQFTSIEWYPFKKDKKNKDNRECSLFNARIFKTAKWWTAKKNRTSEWNWKMKCCWEEEIKRFYLTIVQRLVSIFCDRFLRNEYKCRLNTVRRISIYDCLWRDWHQNIHTTQIYSM